MLHIWRQLQQFGRDSFIRAGTALQVLLQCGGVKQGFATKEQLRQDAADSKQVVGRCSSAAAAAVSTTDGTRIVGWLQHSRGVLCKGSMLLCTREADHKILSPQLQLHRLQPSHSGA